ncbi:hypothetical protein N0V86_008504 [Didymella sp. IMI 355093]|nr:hypothetical protein N0V86_008504 [Didymella sp. IMI 355093]
MSTQTNTPNSENASTLEDTITHQLSQAIIVDKWLRGSYLVYQTKVEDEHARQEHPINVGQFLDILRVSGSKSWFEDEVVNLAISQLTDMQERMDCYVLPTHYAHQLCRLGTGRMDKNGIPAELLQILSDERKRWIIVPCNDAMLNDYNNVAEQKAQQASQDDSEADNTSASHDTQGAVEDHTDAPQGTLGTPDEHTVAIQQSQRDGGAVPNDGESTEGTEEPSQKATHINASTSANEKESRGTQQRSLAYGTHWGLMIVDTQTHAARWLDGLLDIRSKEKDGGRVVYIHSMLTAGIAAGKILCGYDKLLDRNPGHFITSTIKWVPHQHEDNAGPRDNGACGPHMFACLKHLFETPGALDDIHAHFRRGNPTPGNFRRGRKGFNSSATRKQISSQIREEREREEIESASEPSLALNAELMNILGLRVTPERALQAVGNFKSALHNEDNDDPLDMEEGLQAQLRHELKQSYNEQWLRDQEDVNMRVILEMEEITTLAGYTDYREFRKSKLEKTNGVAAGSKSTSSNTRRIYLGKTAYDVPTEDKSIWPPHATDTTCWAADTTELANFARMEPRQIQRWMSKNPDLQKKSDAAKKANPFTRRAMLHHKFKRTFLGESDDDLVDVWLKDVSVFGTKSDFRYVKVENIKDPQLKAGAIRLAMMLHYEGEVAARRITHPKPKPTAIGGSNDKPEDNNDNDDHNADNGGRNGGGGGNPDNPEELPEDEDLLSDNEGDKLYEAYHNNEPSANNEPAGNNNPDSNGSGGSNNPGRSGANNPTNNNTGRNSSGGNNGGGKKKDDSWGKAHPPPTGILDYPRMSNDEINVEKLKYQEKLNDPRFNNVKVNNESWRAILYVDVQGGRFETDDDAVCLDRWLNDSAVFNAWDRVALRDISKTDEIRNRMGLHYYIRPVESVPIEIVRVGQGLKNGGSAPRAASTASGNVGTTSTDATTERSLRPRGQANNSARGLTNAGSRSSSGRNGTSGNDTKDMDFRTMKVEELMKHVTDEMRQDPRVHNTLHKDDALPNEISWRAMCFIDIAKGQFRAESEASCMNIWRHDPLVFTKLQRQMESDLYKPETVISMMTEQYCQRDWFRSGKRERVNRPSYVEPDDRDISDDILNFGDSEIDTDDGDINSDNGGEYTEEGSGVSGALNNVSQAPSVASSNSNTKRKRDTTEPSSEITMPSKRLKTSQKNVTVKDQRAGLEVMSPEEGI